MTKLEIYILIVLATVITFALRFLPMYTLENRRLAPWLEKALRYVPAATLAGLVFPALLLKDTTLFLSPANDRLIAGILAAIIAYTTRNALATIISGLVILWALQRF